MNFNSMRRHAAPAAVALLAAFALAACGGGDRNSNASQAPAQAAMRCAQLAGMTIPAASIGLATTGAVVASATLVEATGSGASAVGQYCRVQGNINPVDRSAPAIRFQVNLPESWNRKAMMFGGDGYDGSVAVGEGNVPAGPTDRQAPLARGYATFGSDAGHQAGDSNNGVDGSFAVIDEALRNFAGEAIKKTRDTAVAVIRARYADTVQKVYVAGGGAGGREALLAVQNWPADFDGAIVLYPAWNEVGRELQFGRITRQLAQPGAYPNRAKRRVLYDAALAACDGLDGARDGLIGNVSACNASFNPAAATVDGTPGGRPVRCANGVDSGDSCLSDVQLASFNVINTPLQLNYALAGGETGYPGFNAWGTDFGNPGADPLQLAVLRLGLGTEQPAYPMPPATAASMPPYASTSWDQWVKYFVTRNPNVNPLLIDPQNPTIWQNRIVVLSGIQDVDRTDLSAFQARGGKILMAQGAQDPVVSPRATEQYFNRIRNTMGTLAVAGFMRYYEIPGYGHGVSTAFNAAWDSLTALENWVEKGIAPTGQVVADRSGVPGRTRPLCEYPAFPRYNLTGDINAAASFTCATQ